MRQKLLAKTAEQKAKISKNTEIGSQYSLKIHNLIKKRSLISMKASTGPNSICWLFLSFSCFNLLIQSCSQQKDNNMLHPYAANEEVARYMENFEGRGDLTDPLSKATPPGLALEKFEPTKDLRLELVLSEPDIVQPLHISFDHKGRMWVVQYRQYPYPEGLKITDIDNHTRVKFDKSPAAPPLGDKGADLITVFEDTNGDGNYEYAFDAIEGLNIATSVALGRGKIWVLNPPYLLAYDDADGDGVPEGHPQVHLKGFGLEDTHAVANSLTWGPDGWLYGVQGSTTTAKIEVTGNSNSTSFLGQAIWRYHPEHKKFEIFAEGGGNNPFNLEFDSKGRIFSGSNGYGRGPYYKQGAYYIKSWGKHGPLTNPYAFGFLPNMPLQGEKKRFTHSMIIYEGNGFPENYNGKILAANPLHNYLQLTRMEKTGSSFQNIDEKIILSTEDKWFRPVDMKLGPDGGVYIADWYDSRLSHVDPRDTWHKSSGRIYKLIGNGVNSSTQSFDLSQIDTKSLIAYLSHPNKWFRQQALRQLGDRKDKDALPVLHDLFKKGNDQEALEALWGIHLTGGFTEDFAVTALTHEDPHVRMWAIRLVGDAKEISFGLSKALNILAIEETSPEVRSQLAATAKRLPSKEALAIISNLIQHHEDADDPDIPLQVWWALEAKISENRESALTLFENKNLWDTPLAQKFMLNRVMQRLAMEGGQENLRACQRLLELAPRKKHAEILVAGLYQGLGGQDVVSLPEELLRTIQPYTDVYNSLAFSLRSGEKKDLKKAFSIIQDENEPIGKRLSLIHVFGEVLEPDAAGILLDLAVSSNSASAIKQAAIHSLTAYPEPKIGQKLAKAYPSIRADAYVREAAIRLFSSRKSWTIPFFEEIRQHKVIHREDVTYELARNFYLLDDPEITKITAELWPETLPMDAASKTSEMRRVKNIVQSGTGDVLNGKSVFFRNCGQCHRMHGEGGTLGPDLSGYDRSQLDYWLLHTIDPNADIREGFELVNAVTHDGRALTGRLSGSEGQTVSISPPLGGRATTLPKDRLNKMDISEISFMPERILHGLSDKEIRDLFSFLMN